MDATQAAGAVPVEASAWDAELVVSSGYKWLGGHGGVALAAVSPRLLEGIPPLPGWMGAPEPFGFDALSVLVAPDARRFTQSTMSYVSMAGLTVALDQLLALGVARIDAHAQTLAALLIEELADPSYARWMVEVLRVHGFVFDARRRDKDDESASGASSDEETNRLRTEFNATVDAALIDIEEADRRDRYRRWALADFERFAVADLATCGMCLDVLQIENIRHHIIQCRVDDPAMYRVGVTDMVFARGKDTGAFSLAHSKPDA